MRDVDRPGEAIAPPQPYIPFVGREPERHDLRLSLERVLAGRGQMVLLAGEPGIGKTRLAEELADEAQQKGVRVVWGSCVEWEGAPPYYPWRQVIRTLTQHADDDTLRRWLGAYAADVVQIVPEVRERFGEVPEPLAQAPEQARFRLFEGVTHLLTFIAKDQPLLVVLDDLHWADAASLSLLQVLVPAIRDVPILLVGTYRHIEVGRQHPLSGILAEVARGGATARLRLSGLGRDDIGRIIAGKTGRDVPATILEMILRDTEGNPFFVTELVQLLAAQGALDRQAPTANSVIRIPESVRDVIGQRLDRLTRSCNEVLSLASVVGREFSIPLLSRVSRRDLDALLDDLDEAVVAHIIEQDVVVGRYRFCHALIQEVLYQELSPAQRMRLHLSIAEVLEQTPDDREGFRVAELAHHYVQAAPLGKAEKAITYAVRAAEQADAQHAWEEAAGYYERALQALDLLDDPDEEQKCQLFLRLGSMYALSFNRPAARDTFRRATALARAIGNPRMFARAALRFADHRDAPMMWPDPEATALLKDALGALGEEGSPLSIRVLALLAASPHLDTVSSDERKAMSDRALRLARQSGDPSLLGYVLVCRYLTLQDPSHYREWANIASELLRIADTTGKHLFGQLAHNLLAHAALDAGNLDAAEHHQEKAWDILHHSFHQSSRWRHEPFWAALVHRAGFAFARGNLPEVERLTHQARESGADWVMEQGRVDNEFWSVLFLVRREESRLHEIEDDLRSFVAGQPDDVYWLARLALLDAELGRLSSARAALERLAIDDFRLCCTGMWWHVNLPILVEAGAFSGASQYATALHRRLEPFAERYINELTVGYGIGSHYLGVLATMMGNWDDAERRFEDALAVHERMGARLHVVQTQHAFADMLRRRDATGDLARALQLVREAHATSEELRFVRLENLISQLIARIDDGGSTTSTVRPAYGLSPREVEVLRLVAEGMSDREIADRLYISPRTVMRHVGGILNKLGVNSRSAAASVAIRQGII